MASFLENLVVSFGALGGNPMMRSGDKQVLTDKVEKLKKTRGGTGWATQHGHPLNRAMGFKESSEAQIEAKESDPYEGKDPEELANTAHEARKVADEHEAERSKAEKAGNHGKAAMHAKASANMHLKAVQHFNKAHQREPDIASSNALKKQKAFSQTALDRSRLLAKHHEKKAGATPAVKTPEVGTKPFAKYVKPINKSGPADNAQIRDLETTAAKKAALPVMKATKNRLLKARAAKAAAKPTGSTIFKGGPKGTHESVELSEDKLKPHPSKAPKKHHKTASLYAHHMCAELKRKMGSGASPLEIAYQADETAKAHGNAHKLHKDEADRTDGEEKAFHMINAQEHLAKEKSASLVAAEHHRKHKVDYDNVIPAEVAAKAAPEKTESSTFSRRLAILESISNSLNTEEEEESEECKGGTECACEGCEAEKGMKKDK